MKLAEIIFTILWLLLGVAIILFVLSMTIQANIGGMFCSTFLLIVYIIDTKIGWTK